MTTHTTADALIVIDVQRAFVLGPNALPGALELLSAMGILLAHARAARALVVHVQNMGRKGRPDEPGAEGFELVLNPLEGEPVIQKPSDDAFVGTSLEAVLREHKVRSVVLGGLQSEMCVAATARGALARGISVVLPRDAHATYPIPHQGLNVPSIPAPVVSRVAEWSLGDEVILVDCAKSVTFN